MQFFKSTLFVAIAVAASFVAAAPAQSECIPLISKLACTQNSDCCSNECYLPDSVSACNCMACFDIKINILPPKALRLRTPRAWLVYIEFLWDSEGATMLFYLPAFVFLLQY
ncbi:hypothetical protein FIBSPDRAFT_891191 [Athelia psychrophila]|uniref:Extracellular membrane protein CFEM domain-containing protein n=1 Tax=Athelia psychrophila TaxID=1759441 RepID=A0A166K3H4_9AGAM|nr:hypothetical protein FIBSPDRAFT_891191 [Fibularhizoctonia sp. CBS 109695]